LNRRKRRTPPPWHETSRERPDCGRKGVLCWHCYRGIGGCWSSAA
jgi:hypothetical protein